MTESEAEDFINKILETGKGKTLQETIEEINKSNEEQKKKENRELN